jgi:hypothetical protein
VYTGIRLKSEILRWSLLIIIAFSFAFALALGVFSKSMESRVSFKVTIIDEDNTRLSKEAVTIISGLSGVTLTREDADVKYTIKKGYEDNFSKGRFDGLIEVNKNSLKQGISLLNDRIVTKLVSDYIYLNLYERINSVESISFESYKKNLERTKLNNEILLIKVNDGKLADNLATEVDFTSYIALFFLLTLSISISIGAVIKHNKMRTSGLLDRLELSGTGETKVIILDFLASCIKSMGVVLPFILCEFETKIFIITAILFALYYVIGLLIERVSKSEDILVIVLRSVMILFLGLGMVFNFYY